MTTPSEWGRSASNFEPNENAHWVKARELAGQSFMVVRVNKGQVKNRPSYIFELSDGALFSVNADSTIGQQITRGGIPPAGKYTIVKNTSAKSPAGYSLSLRPVE